MGGTSKDEFSSASHFSFRLTWGLFLLHKLLLLFQWVPLKPIYRHLWATQDYLCLWWLSDSSDDASRSDFTETSQHWLNRWAQNVCAGLTFNLAPPQSRGLLISHQMTAGSGYSTIILYFFKLSWLSFDAVVSISTFSVVSSQLYVHIWRLQYNESLTCGHLSRQS